MVHVRFHGRILPEAFEIEILNLKPMHLRNDAGKIINTVTFNIAHDQIEIDCEVESFQSDKDFYRLYSQALDISRVIADLISFSEARPLTVLIEKITPPGETEPKGILIQFPDLRSLCTFWKEGDDLNEVINLLGSDAHIIWALRDMIEAIEIPNRVPLNCGRVLDAIRNLIAPDSENDRKKGWKRLSAELQLGEGYTKFVTDHSISPRHGRRRSTTGVTNIEIQRRTWTTMNRFLEYRKRGNKTLPISEFPLVNG
jgi:hypothetical protein